MNLRLVKASSEYKNKYAICWTNGMAQEKR